MSFWSGTRDERIWEAQLKRPAPLVEVAANVNGHRIVGRGRTLDEAMADLKRQSERQATTGEPTDG